MVLVLDRDKLWDYDRGVRTVSVYVDDVVHNFGRMKMCHLWADTEAELFDMVKKIGVDSKWVQGHPTSIGKAKDVGWVHFDIALSKKALALKYGAILTDKYGPVVFTSMQRIARAIETGDTEMRERAEARIAQIERLRAKAPIGGNVCGEMELG